MGQHRKSGWQANKSRAQQHGSIELLMLPPHMQTGAGVDEKQPLPNLPAACWQGQAALRLETARSPAKEQAAAIQHLSTLAWIQSV
jgi:hypothetical protein